MTVAGCYVAGPDLAFIWADTETFTRGKPAPHRNKLAINGVAGMVCAGAGWVGLSDAAAHVTSRALSIDDAVPRLGDPLRRTALDMCKDPYLHPAEIAAATICVAGWSPRMGRVVAYACSGTALFQPVLTSRFAAPDPNGWADAFQPADPHCMAELARRQLALLREGLPDADAGTLSLAVIRGRHVKAGPFLDLATGELLWPGLRDVAPELKQLEPAAEPAEAA